MCQEFSGLEYQRNVTKQMKLLDSFEHSKRYTGQATLKRKIATNPQGESNVCVTISEF